MVKISDEEVNLLVIADYGWLVNARRPHPDGTEFQRGLTPILQSMDDYKTCKFTRR